MTRPWKKRDSVRTSAYLFLSSLDMRVFVIMLRRGKSKSCIFNLGIFWNSRTFNRAFLNLNSAKKTLVFLWFQHTPFPLYALHSWNKDAIKVYISWKQTKRNPAVELIFIFHFVNAVYSIDWFVNIELSLHPRNKSNLITVYDPFNYYWIWFVNILLRIFHLCS